MSLSNKIKIITTSTLIAFSFNCKETSGLHPGIMINRTKAVPLYLETLKKQVQEDDLGKFSWNNDIEYQKDKPKNLNNEPIQYQKPQDIVSNSKLNILFNIAKNELSDFAISKIDEKNFIIETDLKEIPISNIKRRVKINFTRSNEITMNIEIYDEKFTRHNQEENMLKKKILNKYNSTLKSMRI